MTTLYNYNFPNWHLCYYWDGDTEFSRWFKNWAQEKEARGPGPSEWMTIEEEVFYTVRGRERRRYAGTIGADHHKELRRVEFSPGAPPPPTFFQPIVTKYEPPKALTPAEQKAARLRWVVWQAEYEMRRKAEGPPPPEQYGPPLPPEFVLN